MEAFDAGMDYSTILTEAEPAWISLDWRVFRIVMVQSHLTHLHLDLRSSLVTIALCLSSQRRQSSETDTVLAIYHSYMLWPSFFPSLGM